MQRKRDTDRGMRIRMARINRGFSNQEDFGAAIGCGQSMVSVIEKGGDFSYGLLQKIIKVLGVSYDYLIGKDSMLKIRRGKKK